MLPLFGLDHDDGVRGNVREILTNPLDLSADRQNPHTTQAKDRQ